MHEFTGFFDFRPVCPFRPVSPVEPISAFYGQDGQETKAAFCWRVTGLLKFVVSNWADIEPASRSLKIVDPDHNCLLGTLPVLAMRHGVSPITSCGKSNDAQSKMDF
jgi:hypothetical protein